MQLSLFQLFRNNLAFSIATAAMQLLLTVVTGRILSPNDYGQFAAAGAAIATASAVGSRGLSLSLIRSPTTNAADMTNAYVAAISISLLAAFGLLFFGAVSSHLAPGSALQNMMVQFSGAVIVFSFIASPSSALLQRDLRIAAIGGVTFASIGIGNGVVTILLALVGAGPWALFLGALTNAAIYFGGTAIAARPTIAWQLNVSGILTTIRQALLISGGRLLDTLLLQLPIFALTFQSTEHELGLFQRMQFFSYLVFQVTIGSAVSVIIPIVARRHDDLAALRDYFQQFMKLMGIAAVIFVVAGWYAANDIIAVIFGSQWVAGTPMFRPALLASAFLTLFTVIVVFNESCGRNRQRYMLVSSAVTLLSGLLFYHGGDGGVSAAHCLALTTGLLFIVGLALTCRWLGISIRRFFVLVLPTALTGAALVVALAILDNMLATSVLTPIVRLLCFCVGTSIIILPLLPFAIKEVRKNQIGRA